MKHYYFCGYCGDTHVSSHKEDLICQGMANNSHWAPLVYLGKGAKGKKRQKDLATGFEARKAKHGK